MPTGGAVQTADEIAAPIAVTMGEPGGIGGEIAVAAWRARTTDDAPFFLIDDPERLAAFGAPIQVILAPSEAAAAFGGALPVIDHGLSVSAAPGRADGANAHAVIAAIEQAVRHCLAGEAAAMVTNPIQKASLIAEGFQFPGHTEFIASLTSGADLPSGRRWRGPLMMIAGPDLRTIPVTIHQSVREAAAALTPGMIIAAGRVAAEALTHDFGVAAPRLAVSGLNPHAGEGGAIGREDAEIIAPAIEALRAEGIDAAGPLPADTMFHADARACYDVAICMLHDQALIPAKTLAFHEAVNVTLGLPIVRTSPDHGTALDISGKGLARADSFIAAWRLAARIARARMAAR